MANERRAARQRRYRRRRDAGRAILPVVVDLVALEVRLLEVGLLRPEEVEDREALARALERVVELWTDESVTSTLAKAVGMALSRLRAQMREEMRVELNEVRARLDMPSITRGALPRYRVPAGRGKSW